MYEFFNTIGVPGVMAFLGCWLILGAIIGKLLAISHFLQQDVVLPRAYQRVLLGMFGALLLGPGLFAAYQGSASRFVSPTVPEQVASSNSGHASSIPIGRPRLMPASLIAIPPQGSSNGCRPVESFGLFAHSVRRLKYADFHGQVLLYVGNISSPSRGSTDVFLFSGSSTRLPDGRIDDGTFQRTWNDANPLRLSKPVQNVGDSFTFPYDGHQFRLTVTQIYKVLVGNDQIAVDICEM